MMLWLPCGDGDGNEKKLGYVFFGVRLKYTKISMYC